MALLQETEKRLVVLCDHYDTVFPMKQLVSPMLVVNHESRILAKAFYMLTIKVYRVKKGYSRCWSEPSVGIMHLNPDRDIFMKGLRVYPINLFAECRIPYEYIAEAKSIYGCIQRVFDVVYDCEIGEGHWPKRWHTRQSLFSERFGLSIRTSRSSSYVHGEPTLTLDFIVDKGGEGIFKELLIRSQIRHWTSSCDVNSLLPYKPRNDDGT